MHTDSQTCFAPSRPLDRLADPLLALRRAMELR